MLRLKIAAVTSVVFILTAHMAASSQVQESLAHSCSRKPFFSVSISTPRHDAIAPVQITLVDPKGREQGAQHGATSIPNSRYQIIAEIPASAAHSLAHAIEICDAQPGQYELIIHEHGNGAYRVTVMAEKGDADEYSLVLRPISREGRIRRYRLIFKSANGRASVMWLDNLGHEQLHIENADW